MKDKSYGVEIGQKWVRQLGAQKECKVMAVVDGYAVLRYPGCVPFVAYCKHMIENGKWTLVPKQLRAKV